MGTPKSLTDAIDNGIYTAQTFTDEASNVEVHVKDFLSQKFTNEMLYADDKSLEMLKNLWAAITGEKLKG